MFIGHLDIIAFVPISEIVTHNRTLCNSPEFFQSSESISEIQENLHLGKITRYTVYMYIYMYVYACVCTYICICMHMCVYLCVYVYM